MLRKTIFILFSSCLLCSPKIYSQDENELSICEHFYTACEISQMVYDEYLFSIEIMNQFGPDDPFIFYLKGYSTACLNLYLRINMVD